MASKKITTNQDTGWGVIYRLNGLFNEIEELSVNGDYSNWNMKLDRVWSNLIYRNSLKIDKDSNGKIKNIYLDDEDNQEKEYFDKEIMRTKNEFNRTKKELKKEGKTNEEVKAYIKAKNEFYKAHLLKEIWLKKLMYELGLYLKETEYNPAGAMWGGK